MRPAAPCCLTNRRLSTTRPPAEGVGLSSLTRPHRCSSHLGGLTGAVHIKHISRCTVFVMRPSLRYPSSDISLTSAFELLSSNFQPPTSNLQVTYVCPNSTNVTNYTSLTSGCNSSWTGNNGTYGPLVATTSTGLYLATPSSGSYPSYNSYTSLPVVINIVDSFGQVG